MHASTYQNGRADQCSSLRSICGRADNPGDGDRPKKLVMSSKLHLPLREQMTRDQSASLEKQFRHLLLAYRHRMRTARMEAAARRWALCARHLALDRLMAASGLKDGIWDRNGAHQRLGVGMFRIRIEFVARRRSRRLYRDTSRRYAGSHAAPRRGRERRRSSGFRALPAIVEQVDHLRLDRHVEG